MLRVRVPLSLSIVAGLLACTAGSASAQPQTTGQRACLTALTKNAAKLSRTQAKAYAGCLKSAAGGDLGSCATAEDCVAIDPSGKIAQTIARLRDAEAKSCEEEPDFGRRPASLIGMVTVQEGLGLDDDLLGVDLDSAVVPKASDSRGAACQSKLLKAAGKLAAVLGATYDSCKSAGLADGAITSVPGLDACLGDLDSDPAGKIASARSMVGAAVAGTCRDVDLDAVLPGSCAGAGNFGDCISTRARCRACRRAVSSDNLASDCELFDDGLADDSCSGHAGRCNGRAALCDRAFDAVSYPTTHNAFSNQEEHWQSPNQRYGITRQLADGVRALMLDTYDYAGGLYLCHAYCNLGEELGNTPREPLVAGLAKIRDFLDVNPDAVLSIIFESYITEAQTAQAFADAGLDGYVHAQTPGNPWPTLASLIASGKRLVVFTDDSSASLPWHHYVWDFAWETNYAFEHSSDFTCTINRGNMANSLFILNHFLTHYFGDPAFANEVNRNPLFLDRALQCQSESGGRLPNFVTVDFFDTGKLFSVVNDLNGLGECVP